MKLINKKIKVEGTIQKVSGVLKSRYGFKIKYRTMSGGEQYLDLRDVEFVR